MSGVDLRTTIRDRIDAIDMPRAELARRAGCDASTLFRFLDRGQGLNCDTLGRVLEALDIHLTFIPFDGGRGGSRGVR